MSVFGKKLRKVDGGVYLHWCPGCSHAHPIAVDKPFENGARWTFNLDAERPTFAPSINCVGQCHYFITDGQIIFCSDSKLALAGKAVTLPDWPADLDDWGT